jgi:hypothetical protein
MSEIAPKQNAFKFKIAPHKQKSIVTKNWQEDAPSPSQRGPLLKHNGNSGTVYHASLCVALYFFIEFLWIFLFVDDPADLL